MRKRVGDAGGDDRGGQGRGARGRLPMKRALGGTEVRTAGARPQWKSRDRKPGALAELADIAGVALELVGAGVRRGKGRIELAELVEKPFAPRL